MRERMRERCLDTQLVFHHNGRQIGDVRKAWRSACKKGNLDGLIVHDLRRCAARNLSRAGFREPVAMKITGHKTNSMYRRYRIVDENELREAQEKLQNYLATQENASKVVGIKTAHDEDENTEKTRTIGGPCSEA